MISRLPRWVWFGSSALACIAGMVNAIGFAGFQHQGVTHLTGTSTLFGIALAEGDLAGAGQLAAIVGAFMVGCVGSGALIRDGTLKLGRRYGIALMLESALLCAAVPFLYRSHVAGAWLASCACGLQNGMVSTYSGAVLRTTHVSGMFTDLGIFIGQWLGGLEVDRRRVRLGGLLIVSFVVGAIAGAWGFARFSYATFYFPAVLTGFVGIAYGVYRHRHPEKVPAAGRAG